MLIALITAYLLTSSGTSTLLATFDEAQARIKTHVEDPARRAELIAYVESAERAVKDAARGRARTAGQFVTLMRSQEVKAADAQPLLQRMRAEVQATQEEVIRARFELKSKMSREEWTKAFPRRWL